MRLEAARLVALNTLVDTTTDAGPLRRFYALKWEGECYKRSGASDILSSRSTFPRVSYNAANAGGRTPPPSARSPTTCARSAGRTAPSPRASRRRPSTTRALHSRPAKAPRRQALIAAWSDPIQQLMPAECLAIGTGRHERGPVAHGDFDRYAPQRLRAPSRGQG
jgi:hypothetical protein